VSAGTLDWQPWNMCGVQAELVDGSKVLIDGYQSGDESGFHLVYEFGFYAFSSRRDAYTAAELLNTVLYLKLTA
jgi:hypothetical protein